MKSFFKHIYKVVLCLSFLIMMVGVFIIAPVNAAEQLDAKIKVSYEFQDDFDMIFNCKVYTKGEFDSVRLLVEFEGKTTTLTVPDSYDKESGFVRYIFRDVSAAEMTSVAKATLVATMGNVEYRSETVETNLKDYSMTLLNYYEKLSDSDSKKLCKALVDMLNYGAASQTFFNKNTNNLANKDLTNGQKALGSTLSNYNSPSSCYSKNELSNATATIQKIALSFENPVDLVVYSSFDSDLSSDVSAVLSYKDASGVAKTLTVSSSEFEKQESDNLYRVEFKDIPSDCFKTPLSIVYKKGNKAISSTVTYSCESYAKAILKDNSQDAKVKDLVKKMLAYGDSAKAYAATLPTGCVTYRQFGAMGTGVQKEFNENSPYEDRGINDYYAILMTHDYANLKNLPVKADKGANYYVRKMNPRSYKGALIKTETDWGKANFTIDDKRLENDVISKPARILHIPNSILTEGHCYLFTVEPSEPFQYKYCVAGAAITVYLGLDANLSAYPEYPNKSPNVARTFINKKFSKDEINSEMKFSGVFKEDALYILMRDDVKRWQRHNRGSEKGRPQTEIVYVHKTEDGQDFGRVDESTPLQWDWDNIYTIFKYPIDETTLHVKGGTFTTIVNTDSDDAYIFRGIGINRSNVVMEDVKHYLAEEKDMFTSKSYDNEKERYYAKTGRPYQGFFRIYECVNVTLKNCVFTDHLRAYYAKDNGSSTAPYDYYAEYAATLTIENCHCKETQIPEYGLTNPMGIMDKVTRWGTTGTNYIKDFRVLNSTISRIDAHKGTYGLTVKGSTLGALGIAAVGFGDMNIENVTSYGDNFIWLRRDFGNAWFGDINIKNCTWKIGEEIAKDFIYSSYEPTELYDYDVITEHDSKNNVDRSYYSQLPKNITIDGLTIDATDLRPDNGYGFYNRGINIFSQVIFGHSVVNEDYLSNPQPAYEVFLKQQEDFENKLTDVSAIDKYGHPYYFPIKVTETVTVNNVKVINNSLFNSDDYSDHRRKFKVYLRNPEYTDDSYFFNKEYDKTKFSWDNKVTYLTESDLAEAED